MARDGFRANIQCAKQAHGRPIGTARRGIYVRNLSVSIGRFSDFGKHVSHLPQHIYV